MGYSVTSYYDWEFSLSPGPLASEIFKKARIFPLSTILLKIEIQSPGIQVYAGIHSCSQVVKESKCWMHKRWKDLSTLQRHFLRRGELFTRVFDTRREEGVNLCTSKAQAAGCW